MVYRPEYYGIEQDEQGRSTENVCEVLVRKNRGGKINQKILFTFQPQYNGFYSYENVAPQMTRYNKSAGF